MAVKKSAAATVKQLGGKKGYNREEQKVTGRPSSMPHLPGPLPEGAATYLDWDFWPSQGSHDSSSGEAPYTGDSNLWQIDIERNHPNTPGLQCDVSLCVYFITVKHLSP